MQILYICVHFTVNESQKKVSTRGILGMLLSCKEKSNYVWENLAASNKIVDF